MRGRQSSCAMPRSWHRAARPKSAQSFLLCLHSKSKITRFRLTPTENTREVVWLHVSCILVSKSDRNCTALFTDSHPQENSSLLKFSSTLSNSPQSNLSSVVAVTKVNQIVHLRSLILFSIVSSLISRSLGLSLFLYNSTGENLSPSLLLTCSCWLNSCILSPTFLSASSFAFPRRIFLALSWALQNLGALGALHLIDFSSIISPLRFSRSSVLSVVSCDVASFTAWSVRIFLRSPGLSSPPKGTTPEIVHSGSLRLMSRRIMPA